MSYNHKRLGALAAAQLGSFAIVAFLGWSGIGTTVSHPLPPRIIRVTVPATHSSAAKGRARVKPQDTPASTPATPAQNPAPADRGTPAAGPAGNGPASTSPADNPGTGTPAPPSGASSAVTGDSASPSTGAGPQ